MVCRFSFVNNELVHMQFELSPRALFQTRYLCQSQWIISPKSLKQYCSSIFLLLLVLQPLVSVNSFIHSHSQNVNPNSFPDRRFFFPGEIFPFSVSGQQRHTPVGTRENNMIQMQAFCQGSLKCLLHRITKTKSSLSLQVQPLLFCMCTKLHDISREQTSPEKQHFYVGISDNSLSMPLLQLLLLSKC